MKKRGILDLPFVYIFMIIVIAFILLFGLNMIFKLNELKEKTIYLTFKTDLEREVEKMYDMNKGSVTTYKFNSKNKPLKVPKEIKEICIDGSNVILDNIKYEDFEIENLRSYDNGLNEICVDTKNGYFQFRLENDVIDNDIYVLITKI